MASLSGLHYHTQFDTPHSVELLWTSDRPIAETFTWIRTAIPSDRHPCHQRDSNTAIPGSKRPQTHNLDPAATGICPSINTWVIKFRRIRWKGHESRMGRIEMHKEFCGKVWGKERDRLEDLCVLEWIIVTWVVQKWDGLMGNSLIWLRIGINGGIFRTR